MHRLFRFPGWLGRLCFAVALIGSGVLQLIRHDFVRHVPKLPSWVARPELGAVVSGTILVAAGLAIAVNRKRRPAAIVVAALFFLVLLLYLPGVWANPGAGFMWTNPCKTLALLGAAMVLVAMPEGWSALPPTRFDVAALQPAHWGQCAPPLCAALFGVFLVVCGVQHFVYVDFVVTLVPAWLPGLRFWAYFTGVALIAGGIGVNFRPTARLAAALSGLMIFLWVLLLHIPRAAAGWPEAFEMAGIFEALALSGTGFLLAEVGSSWTPGAGEPKANGRELV